MTVAQLFDSMSASEFNEWQAFEKIDGIFGGRRGDLQAAAISYWSLLPHLGKENRDVSLTDLAISFDPADMKKNEEQEEEVTGFDE